MYKPRTVYTLCVKRGGLVTRALTHVDKENIFNQAKACKAKFGGKAVVTIEWFVNGKDRVACITKSGDWEMLSGI